MQQPSTYVFAAIPLLIIGTVAIWVLSYDRQANNALLNNDTDCVRHFLAHGIFGTGPHYERSPIGLDESVLEPGDLLFCHCGGGQYGYFTHCSLYLGDGKCTEQNLHDGMYIGNVADLNYGYKEIWIMRAPINPDQRQQLCMFAQQYNGSIFDMAAGKNDRRLWNCAKLCWAAYKEINIDLAPQSTRIIPDFLAQYPALALIQKLRVTEQTP